jgi:hypothetical protein
MAKELCSYDLVKDLEMGRFSCVMWVSPNYNHKCLQRKEGDRYLSRSNDRIRDCHELRRNSSVQEFRSSPEARKEKKRNTSSTPASRKSLHC